MPKTPKQKLYCYVDETGQDPRAELFIVVAVVDNTTQDALRSRLIILEEKLEIDRRKWKMAKRNKKYFNRSKKFLGLVLNEKIATVYFKHFKKPVVYYDAIIDTIEKAIKSQAKGDYQAIIYIDGADKKNCQRIGMALKKRKIKLTTPRSARDESEPLIRLADRWAGCI